VDVQALDCAALGDVDDAHPGSLEACLLPVDVVGLQQHHVAAVTAPPLQIASGRGAVLLGYHHLEDPVADGEEGVTESELGDAGIPEADFEAELGDDGLLDRSEIGRDEGDLA
jgi:hypothetical protein